MARQDVVRALVPQSDVDELRADLTRELDIDDAHLEVDEPPPGIYRDERPDLELRALVRTTRIRVAVGAALGAVAGAVVALLAPILRDAAPVSMLILGIGGAVAAGAVVAARSVQVHRDEGPRGEELHQVTGPDRQRLRLITIRVEHDRNAIVDHLADRGISLLDSHHPRVGRHDRGARPADSGNDATGPTGD